MRLAFARERERYFLRVHGRVHVFFLAFWPIVHTPTSSSLLSLFGSNKKKKKWDWRRREKERRRESFKPFRTPIGVSARVSIQQQQQQRPQKQKEEEGFALFQVVLPHLLLGIALTKGYFDEGGLIWMFGIKYKRNGTHDWAWFFDDDKVIRWRRIWWWWRWPQGSHK